MKIPHLAIDVTIFPVFIRAELLGIKAEETRRHSITMKCCRAALLRPKFWSNLMWNGTRLGLLTVRLIDSTKREGETNGDQRSAEYVMLARETRRLMTDLGGGGGKV